MAVSLDVLEELPTERVDEDRRADFRRHVEALVANVESPNNRGQPEDIRHQKVGDGIGRQLHRR